jgi:hypothetical protein
MTTDFKRRWDELTDDQVHELIELVNKKNPATKQERQELLEKLMDKMHHQATSTVKISIHTIRKQMMEKKASAEHLAGAVFGTDEPLAEVKQTEASPRVRTVVLTKNKRATYTMAIKAPSVAVETHIQPVESAAVGDTMPMRKVSENFKAVTLRSGKVSVSSATKVLGIRKELKDYRPRNRRQNMLRSLMLNRFSAMDAANEKKRLEAAAVLATQLSSSSSSSSFV